MTGSRRKLVAIDFDGVLHSYTTPWSDAATISDGPVPGAMQFLRALVDDDRFEVAIVSSRLTQEGGLEAVESWLRNNLKVALGWGAGDRVIGEIGFYKIRPPAFITIDDRGLTFTGEWPDLDTLAAFKPWNKRPVTNDSFELVVADLLPDDDDGGEEPGGMCRRALAKAKARVDLIRQVRLLVVGAEDDADFEATYGTDPDEIAVYTNAAREIIALVRSSSVEGRLPTQGAPKASHTDLVDVGPTSAPEEAAPDRGIFRVSEHVDAKGYQALDLTEKGLRNIIAIATERGDEGWAEVQRLEAELAALRRPDTITLTRDQLTSARREAAAFGTDLSSCSSMTAGAVREVADLVLDAIVAGRRIGDEYDTLLDAEKRISR